MTPEERLLRAIERVEAAAQELLAARAEMLEATLECQLLNQLPNAEMN